MDIFGNFIPNTIVKCSGQDPPWLVEITKAKTELENWVYKECIKNDRPESLFYLQQNLTSEILIYVSKCKDDYFFPFWKKVGDSFKSIKSYCTTVKTLWN